MRTVDKEQFLALQAQLMFLREPTFEPVKGDIRRWRGKIFFNGREYVLEIIVDKNYPDTPPSLYIRPPVKHPLVDKDGRIMLERHYSQIPVELWRMKDVALTTLTIYNEFKTETPQKEGGKIVEREKEKALRLTDLFIDLKSKEKKEEKLLEMFKKKVEERIESLKQEFEDGKIDLHTYNKKIFAFQKLLFMVQHLST
ncbi:MAG: hypothetical protein B6U95_01640 [Thermofilum sp. ex4484_82]|nr:MAG: hypothetical protein B6U95_01640 [Thermofilum sp. ex4484_82]OYT39599.1 MAG: hypothetical protein B6U96_01645 [Archaeoglobales archaeon ex4484_92]